MPYAKKQQKSTGAKASYKMLMKLTHGDKENERHEWTPPRRQIESGVRIL